MPKGLGLLRSGRALLSSSPLDKRRWSLVYEVLKRDPHEIYANS